MRVKANYKRGACYYYAHRATMACAFIGGAALIGERKAIPMYLKRPEPASEYHRIAITVIRTKAEAKALNRKYAKLRAKRRAEARALANNTDEPRR